MMGAALARNLTWPVAAVTLALDQISKLLIVRWIGRGEPVTVIPGFFDLTLVTNTGGVFGILRNLDGPLRDLLFSAIPLLAVALMVWWGLRLRDARPWSQIALGLILGGAVGNLADRFRLGHVVDFLDAYLGAYHWPAFNLADSGICVGVAMLLVEAVFMHRTGDGAHPAFPSETP